MAKNGTMLLGRSAAAAAAFLLLIPAWLAGWLCAYLCIYLYNNVFPTHYMYYKYVTK
jgi:hypothetical protein